MKIDSYPMKDGVSEHNFSLQIQLFHAILNKRMFVNSSLPPPMMDGS